MTSRSAKSMLKCSATTVFLSFLGDGPTVIGNFALIIFSTGSAHPLNLIFRIKILRFVLLHKRCCKQSWSFRDGLNHFQTATGGLFERH